MYWMLLPLRRYAQFTGRSRPKEYWMFVLFMVLASILVSVVDFMLGFGATTSSHEVTPYGFWAGWSYGSGGPLLALFALAMVIPSLAVGVRRLHDSGRSGWWLLIGSVPLVGALVLLIFMIIGGTHGPNRFGPDPVAQAVLPD